MCVGLDAKIIKALGIPKAFIIFAKTFI